jgi:hypothetical protein
MPDHYGVNIHCLDDFDHRTAGACHRRGQYEPAWRQPARSLARPTGGIMSGALSAVRCCWKARAIPCPCWWAQPRSG